MLLDTSFVHAIDAPSLSLLVPLLDSGLMMHDNKSKEMAAQLMGNICNLTKDARDLLPYMGILMPAIKNSLFDAIPEIRASAAKALGSFSKGLGIEHSKDKIHDWLINYLNQTDLQSAEKSGAAQGMAEIISVHGKAFFEQNIKVIIEKARHQNKEIRESYRGVLIFLPTSYSDFANYLPLLVPLMIEGLADEADEVRKVSMRNVKICIKKFAKQSPDQLVKPVLRMMFDKDFRVRMSSSILMY